MFDDDSNYQDDKILVAILSCALALTLVWVALVAWVLA